MEKSLSDKIKIMSLLCTVMVVYRHSLNYLAFFNSWEGHGISGFVEDGFSQFTQVAVPFFFIVSGFFFFKKSYYKQGAYLSMLQKKSKTLLIPFLFWNLIGLFVLLVVDKGKIASSFIDSIIQLLNSSWYSPLWYVRDLMTMMLLAPIYGWLFREYDFKYRLISRTLLILVMVVLFYNWRPVDCGWISTEGIFFFCLGGILSHKEHWLLYKMPIAILLPLVCLWIYICFFFNLFPHTFINRFNTLLALLLCWNIIRFIPRGKIEMLLKLSVYSFFIYVTHFYIIKVFKVVLGKLFFGSDIIATFSFLILPIITIAIGVFIAKSLICKFPRLYDIITGGR